ncbi:serine/threonine protein kinase [Oscillatoria sp. FACHB-1407]|uniref:serine/threonine protein kinase n=1 Tax=Oscillatoria sp. FACHB-1407 TaxID=2692847 RepID=UPI0016877F6F|nr:serine/threonine-protein kinase [Oscillatoria sp. FACHB-1407]MBD2461396.1 serine/threonine protein kinase [Oscillatoria sp. FACHB-1407]
MLQPDHILRDRYQLKHKLGQGAGRQTWLAHDLAEEPAEPVVIKLMTFGEEVRWDDLRLFEREAQILRHLNHPHIPKYRDFFSIDDRLLRFGLVQNYIPGTSLKDMLAQGKHFSEQQVRQIATNLLHILSYLHELSPPVLHRDIKPSNLILGEDKFIYLVDFGAVQDKAAIEGETFTVVGTYGYAPMEQFGGRAVPASDLYALGATLIHLLTGVSPAELPQQDLQIQFTDHVSLDPDFVDWIQILTQPDVTKRFQTARQALEALRSPQQDDPTPLPQRRYTPIKRFDVAESVLERSPQRKEGFASSKTVVSLTSPSFTQIQIHHAPDRLLIQTPGANRWSLLLLIPIGIILLIILRAVLPVITITVSGAGLFSLFLLLFALSIFWEFLPTFIDFQQDRFIIYKRPFNFTIQTTNQPIADIQDVFHTLKTFRSGKRTYEKRVVVVQTSYNETYFAKGFSWDECNWLVEVIQQWLGFSR